MGHRYDGGGLARFQILRSFVVNPATKNTSRVVKEYSQEYTVNSSILFNSKVVIVSFWHCFFKRNQMLTNCQNYRNRSFIVSCNSVCINM